MNHKIMARHSPENLEFLKRLFAACSDEQNCYGDGLSLGEIYERIEDTAETERGFIQALAEADIDSELHDSLFCAFCAATWAFELQGFINGYRQCRGLLW